MFSSFSFSSSGVAVLLHDYSDGADLSTEAIWVEIQILRDTMYDLGTVNVQLRVELRSLKPE